MSKFYTEHFNTLEDCRKVEEALQVIMSAYTSREISADVLEQLDFAVSIISEHRSLLVKS